MSRKKAVDEEMGRPLAWLLRYRFDIANARAGFGWTTFPWYANHALHCITQFCVAVFLG